MAARKKDAVDGEIYTEDRFGQKTVVTDVDERPDTSSNTPTLPTVE